MIKKIKAFVYLPLRFFKRLLVKDVKETKNNYKDRYPRESLANRYDALDFIRKVQLDKINDNLITQICQKIAHGKPLRIGFLVNEGSKWNCETLLNEIKQEKLMESQIYLALNDIEALNHNDRKNLYLKEREFFLSIDEDVIDLYDWENDVETSVEEIDVDILFHQQPGGMRDYPRRMAGRALNVYMHYGFMLMSNHGMHYNIGSFHSYLWKYFTQTEGHKLLHLDHDPSAYDRIVVTGYPKLDIYQKNKPISCNIWKEDKKSKKIIFAPHHSLGEKSLKMSTFRWNSQFMYNLMKDNREFQWVYKPHPKLKYSVVQSKVMTQIEYQEYEKALSSLDNVTIYDTGNYFDIFRTSDVLITDCGSFLAEYMPTGNPIIWLKSENAIDFNPIGAALSDAFYKVTNVNELKLTFQKVVVDGEDPLKVRRNEKIKLLFPGSEKSSTNVVNFLKSYFEIN